MPTSQSIEVSIIVPCRNEVRAIQSSLDSILHQDYEGGVEILIADGISDDGTREILRRFAESAPNLRVIDNPEMIAGTGLNAAIRAAAGDIIIRMDAHTDYAHDYVRNCVRVQCETGADNVGGPARTQAHGYIPEAIAHAFQMKFACGGAKFHDPEFEGYVDTVPYGCWKKSTLERVGLFDETLRRNQDDELNLRIISSGGKIWQSPKIVSRYRPRASVTGLFRQYFEYGLWKTAVIRKHRRMACWRHLIPGVSIASWGFLVLGATGAVLVGKNRLAFGMLSVLALLAALYCASSIYAALAVAARRGWRFLPILPFVVGTFHLSYGLGFLMGILSPRPVHFRVRRRNFFALTLL